MEVFVVQHVRDIGGDCEDVKLIGVYASEEDAGDAVAALMKQPGFRDHKDGFSIDAHEIGRTDWEDGFVTIPHESASRAGALPPADLTVLFRTLGADSPEGWAASQLAEGIPQLHRFLFLRQAWKRVVTEGDTSWINASIAESERRPDAPYASVGTMLSALREKGISDDQITDLVRGVQGELLFQLCHLLENPAIEEPEVQEVAWGLFTLDADGGPGEPIVSLHESVLETDPTGREMRPRRS